MVRVELDGTLSLDGSITRSERVLLLAPLAVCLALVSLDGFWLAGLPVLGLLGYWARVRRRVDGCYRVTRKHRFWIGPMVVVTVYRDGDSLTEQHSLALSPLDLIDADYRRLRRQLTRQLLQPS